MTAHITGNTARDAAAADGTRQMTGARGTSVLLQNLGRAFGATRALDGLSIEMAPGELVALLGPSGCGKTTALRIVAGFETADTGKVLIDGKDISSVPAARRDMGMVFQSYSLFPNMTALDNVGFGLRMRKAGSAQRRNRAGELLDMVGLASQAKQYPHQLSGGQQQRVALARALAIEPRVLLLDEPLSALDAKVRLQLREQIRTLQQRLGTTTLFVTHDQEEALSMADRVGVMRQGKLEQIAAPDELYKQPATAFVAEFVGVMNRIPAELRGEGMVAVLDAVVPVKGQQPDGGAVDVLARPEELRMDVVENGNGIVTTRNFLGSVTRVGVLLSGDVTVQIDKPSSESAALAPGTSVTVSLPMDPVLVAPRQLSRLGHGRRCSVRAAGQRRVPPAYLAGVAERRSRELYGRRVGIRGGADVVPFQDVLAEGAIPARLRRGQGHAGEAIRRRMRVGVKRRLAVSGVSRPPADRDLLRVHRVAHDEVVRRRIGRLPGEQAHREVERTPPRVDRSGAAAIRRPVCREDQRGLGRCGEVTGDLAWIVVRVLLVGVQRHLPRDLLRRRIDLHRAAKLAHRGQHPAGHLADRPVGGERNPLGPAAAVLDDRLVDPQVQRDNQGSGAVGRGQRRGLPAPCRQPQRRVLQLRLGRRQLHRELAEDLGMRVQGVTRRAPLLIRECGPSRRHDRQATASRRSRSARVHAHRRGAYPPARRLSGNGGRMRSSVFRSAAVPARAKTSQGTLAASSRCSAARSSVVCSDAAATGVSWSTMVVTMDRYSP
jgi:putative spermidine/putrescine transport system ATP-binding protein